jgi:hypothetical protein
LLDEDAAPPGPLAAEEPPLVPPLLLEEPPDDEPLMPPLEEDPPIPLPLDEEEPVPLLGLLGLELLELDDPGELGAAVDEDDDEPPGTTTVSRSFVVELVLAEPLGAVLVPPGTTVVVSLRSQADKASRAPARTTTYPLRFIFTLLSSEDRYKMHRRFSNWCAGRMAGRTSYTRVTPSLKPLECRRSDDHLLLIEPLLEHTPIG